MTTTKCNSLNYCPFQCAIESPHPEAEKILLILLSYMKITSSLRRSLFIGAVKVRNTVLIECILDYDVIKDDERCDLLNVCFNINQNYMKRSLISDAETTPLIYAINKKDRQLINFLLADEDVNVNLLNRPLVDASPLVIR